MYDILLQISTKQITYRKYTYKSSKVSKQPNNTTISQFGLFTKIKITGNSFNNDGRFLSQCKIKL